MAEEESYDRPGIRRLLADGVATVIVHNQGDGASLATSGALLLNAGSSFLWYPTDSFGSITIPSLAPGSTTKQLIPFSFGTSVWVGSRVDTPALNAEYSEINNANPFMTPPHGNRRVKYPFNEFLAVASKTGTVWQTLSQQNIYPPRPDLKRADTMYTRGDFNGDGETDLIITNASGSYWYLGTPYGGWEPNYYVRNDLKLHEVNITVGDFNGDGFTDFITTTAAGSEFYYAEPSGFSKLAYSRPDLTINNTMYTPGDFNGDGYTDLVITTPSGSYWYLSNGAAQWLPDVIVMPDLKLGQVAFTAGDFNGDGATDLVITTPAGSTWYLFSAFTTLIGGDPLHYTTSIFPARPDLRLYGVRYTPADLNGDGMTDLVITTTGGSWWYILDGKTGTITQPYYSEALKVGYVLFRPIQFVAASNGGRSDLLITTASGSVLSFSASDGTPTAGSISIPAWTINDVTID